MSLFSFSFKLLFDFFIEYYLRKLIDSLFFKKLFIYNILLSFNEPNFKRWINHWNCYSWFIKHYIKKWLFGL